MSHVSEAASVLLLDYYCATRTRHIVQALTNKYPCDSFIIPKRVYSCFKAPTVTERLKLHIVLLGIPAPLEQSNLAWLSRQRNTLSPEPEALWCQESAAQGVQDFLHQQNMCSGLQA